MFCDADLDPPSLFGAPVDNEVKVDYMVLGICFDPALYDRVRTMFKRSSVHLGRLWLDRGVIFFDGKSVGSVGGSQAPTTRYGRKFLFHFKGEWFRCGLTASDAVQLVRRAEILFAESGILGDDIQSQHWINFVSIDRLDYALECLYIGVEPYQMVGKELAHGWRIPDLNLNVDDGNTVYGGTTRHPKRNRTTHPLIRLYSYLEPRRLDVRTVRAEVEVPRVRTTSGQGSLIGAALVARDQIEAATGHKIEVVDVGEEPRGVGIPLRVLDFDGLWLPDHVFNVPYSGHPTATLRRLARQGATIIERTCSSAVLSALIPQECGFAGSPAQTLDGEELQGAERVREGAPAEGSPVSLALQAPLTLEELDHLEQTVLEFRRTFYPDSKTVGEREALPKMRHYMRAEVLGELVDRVAGDVAQQHHPSDEGGRGDFMQEVVRAEVRAELREDVARMLDSYSADLERERKALDVQDDERAAELAEAQADADNATSWARAARAWRASCEAKLKRAQLRRNRLLSVASGPARRVYERAAGRADDEIREVQAEVAEAAGEVMRLEEVERVAREELARASALCWDRFSQLEQGRVWLNKLRVPPVVRIRSRIDEGVEAPWAYRRDVWVDEYVRYREGDRRVLPKWADEVF